MDERVEGEEEEEAPEPGPEVVVPLGCVVCDGCGLGPIQGIGECMSV